MQRYFVKEKDNEKFVIFLIKGGTIFGTYIFNIYGKRKTYIKPPTKLSVRLNKKIPYLQTWT